MFTTISKTQFTPDIEVKDYRRKLHLKKGFRMDCNANEVAPFVIGYCRDEKFGSYKVMCLKGKNLKKFWFRLSAEDFKSLKSWCLHREERANDGVSFRDAWNIDMWVSSVLPKILTLLHKNTHSYPGNEMELHEKFCNVGHFSKELNPDEKLLSGPELEIKLYHDDLIRMAFLFTQYDEDCCIETNPYKFRLHMERLPAERGKHFTQIIYTGTKEEVAETKKYRKREDEIAKYRLKCLKKALRLLSVYIEHLWD